MPDQSDAKVIADAWRMTSYVRNQEASLNGALLLTAGRWSTLYFFGAEAASHR